MTAKTIGTTALWGFTPSLNLLQNSSIKEDTVNIFLMGPHDCRHILRTLCECDTEKFKKINVSKKYKK